MELGRFCRCPTSGLRWYSDSRHEATTLKIVDQSSNASQRLWKIADLVQCPRVFHTNVYVDFTSDMFYEVL